MFAAITVGATGTKSLVVAVEHTAAHWGSGSLYVFSTPYMVALMEGAAVSAADPLLPEDYQTVGTRLDVRHLAATLMGEKVTARAELTAKCTSFRDRRPAPRLSCRGFRRGGHHRRGHPRAFHHRSGALFGAGRGARGGRLHVTPDPPTAPIPRASARLPPRPGVYRPGRGPQVGRLAVLPITEPLDAPPGAAIIQT